MGLYGHLWLYWECREEGLGQTYKIDTIFDEDNDVEEITQHIDINDEWLDEASPPANINRVASLYHERLMFYAYNPILITCDSGATSNLIRHSLMVELDM